MDWWNGQHVFVLGRWLTTKEVDDVEVQLKEKLGEGEYVFWYFHLEIAIEEYEEVPTVLETRFSTTIRKNLTEMYGLPKYGELDPTPYTAPFYLRLLSGMMAVDLDTERFSGWEHSLNEVLPFDKGMNRNLEVLPLTKLPSNDLGIVLISIGADFTIPATITFSKTSLRLWSYWLFNIHLWSALSLGATTQRKFMLMPIRVI